MPCTPDTASCTACFFPKRPLLTLRGLCPISPFDKQYITTTNYHNDKPTIKGYFHSSVLWDMTSWQLKTVTTNVTYAKLHSKNEAKYPVGRQEWKIFRDPCFSGEDVTVNLTLTACSTGQYTCDNGHCIDIELARIFMWLLLVQCILIYYCNYF